MIVSSGIDQVMSSTLPDSTKLGWKKARLLDDRNHHPNMSAASIVGTTIGSMMINEPTRIDDVPSATTPLGSRTISCLQPASASSVSMAPQRRATAGTRALNRGRDLNALLAKKTGSRSMTWPYWLAGESSMPSTTILAFTGL